MMAFCSSSDFKKKFIDETIRTPRNVPSFMTTMSLRNSEISRYFCVDGVPEFAFGFVSCVAFFGIVIDIRQLILMVCTAGIQNKRDIMQAMAGYLWRGRSFWMHIFQFNIFNREERIFLTAPHAKGWALC